MKKYINSARAIGGLLVFAMTACSQKEIKVSRSAVSVQKQVTGFSSAYIYRNEKGTPELNRNNLIGNTHWVLSVDRDLTLEEIGPFLETLSTKKYSSGLHEDTKGIWFVYSDTLHRQNAYVRMPFKSMVLTPPPVYELGKGVASLWLHSVGDASNLNTSEVNTYLVGFDKNMSSEAFVNILIEIDQQQLAQKISHEVHIY